MLSVARRSLGSADFYSHSPRLVPESDSETAAADPMDSLQVGGATKSAPILVSACILRTTLTVLFFMMFKVWYEEERTRGGSAGERKSS